MAENLQTPPQPPPPRRLATWQIVALTLGGVFLAGLIFLGGLFTGVAISGVAGGTGGTSGGTTSDSGGSGDDTGPDTSGEAAPSGPASPFDECLVGTWKTTEYEQKASTPQGESVLTGLVRTFTFDASGKHVVTYDNATASMTSGEVTSELVFDGTVKYQVALSGKTMKFTLESVNGSVTVRTNGEEKNKDLKPGTSDVTYSCSGDTYTEEAKGYREVAKRQP